jgi:N-dimethylarginine dimethylaminohydrolase
VSLPAPAGPTVSERPAVHRRLLMCRPEHFTVAYRINPWMNPEDPTDTSVALGQWQTLYDTYRALGHEVDLIDPIAGLPDMVYAANGGFTLDVLDPTGADANIAYLPAAFDEVSRAELGRRYPDAVEVGIEDARWLGLNSISDGRNVVIASRAKGFEASLRECGYHPIGLDLAELLLGGGGVKCCTLELRGER